MTKLSNKITLLNMVTSLVMQIVTILSGFIIPRLILGFFGSEVNGLVNSLNQFLNYIAIVEGGMTGVVTASLYKPLVDHNTKKVSAVLKTASAFYKKIGIIFVLYTTVLAVVYPIVFKTSFSLLYIASLTFILSLNLLVQYMFALTYKTLLNADKKVYVVSLTQSIIVSLSIVFSILAVKVYPSVHILKLISGLLFFVQPIVFSLYVKKNYNICNNTVPDNELIKNRWNGFAINIAAFIHNSTDLTILTLFTSLEMVSVYSVYALVTSGLKQIIIAITSGINPTIGQAYAKGIREDLCDKLDLYEYIVLILVFFSYSVAGMLITPFVMIYTNGINDADYFQPLFGWLIVCAEALYLLKLPHLKIAYSANKFKEITIPGYLEAAINIVVSLILVRKFGIAGVSIGTIIAMFYRLMFHVRYTTVLIPGWKQSTYYRKMLLFFAGTVLGVFLCKIFVGTPEYSIISWIIHGSIYIGVMLTIYLVISILFFKKEMKYIITYLKRV